MKVESDKVMDCGSVGTGFIHKLNGSHSTSTGQVNGHSRTNGKSKQKKKPSSSVNWSEAVERAFSQTNDKLFQLWAERLGIVPESLTELKASCLFSSCDIPERNGSGEYTGYNRRGIDGTKLFSEGGKRGLTFSDDWDKGGPIVVVEGGTDTAAGVSIGLSTIGRPSNSGGVELLAELLRSVSRQRQIIILGENDQKPNGDWPGRDGARSVATQLAARLERPVDWSLPPDDVKDLRDWLRSAESNRTAETFLSALQPETIDQSKLAKPDEAINDPFRLAKVYLDSVPRLYFWRGEWWRWEHPRYREVEESELRAEVRSTIHSEFVKENIVRKSGPQTSGEQQTTRPVTKSLLINVIGAMESLVLLPWRTDQPSWVNGIDPPFPATDALATTSCVVNLPALFGDIKESDVANPTPDLFTSNTLEFGFDASAECPHWERFLRDAWPDDLQSIDTLQEWCGYLIMADTSQQKACMLIGPPRSGKGTIARIIRGLVGNENYVAPSLGSLDGQFGLQPLLNKTVAVVGDARLSSRRDVDTIVERLLGISGEDPQTVDRKNKSSVTTQLAVRFTILSNELPMLADASASLPSRLVLLRLTQSFYGREDIGLTKRLLAELPGVLNWAIDGWKRLRDRGHFVQPESSQTLLEQMIELSSPINAFVADRCKVEPGLAVQTGHLYRAWCNWCEDAGRRPGTAQSFGKNLRAAFPTIDQPKQVRNEGERLRIYEGINLTGTQPATATSEQNSMSDF